MALPLAGSFLVHPFPAALLTAQRQLLLSADPEADQQEDFQIDKSIQQRFSEWIVCIGVHAGRCVPTLITG